MNSSVHFQQVPMELPVDSRMINYPQLFDSCGHICSMKRFLRLLTYPMMLAF